MDRRGFLRVFGKAAAVLPALALVPTVMPKYAQPVVTSGYSTTEGAAQPAQSYTYSTRGGITYVDLTTIRGLKLPPEYHVHRWSRYGSWAPRDGHHDEYQRTRSCLNDCDIIEVNTEFRSGGMRWKMR